MEYESVMPLGTVNKITDTGLLGQVGRFLDKNVAAQGKLTELFSMMPIYARLTRNASGGVLSPGAVLKHDTGSTYGPYKAVGGIAAIGSNEVACGVVDPWLTSDVADEAHFWQIFWGPCKFLFTTGTTLAPGDLLVNGASGRVTKYDVSSPSASNNLHTVGRVLDDVDTGEDSDTLFRGFAMFWK